MVNTSNSDDRGRFSARRKTDTVLRILRGEGLELLSRELGVTAATLSGWRDDFLALAAFRAESHRDRLSYSSPRSSGGPTSRRSSPKARARSGS